MGRFDRQPGLSARRVVGGATWRGLVGLIIASLLLVTAPAPLSAATVPSLFADVPIASGLPSVTCIAFAPDGRLFVCEQSGRLRVIQNDVLLETPFLTMTGLDTTGERGLLGVAFDPDFATNRFVYLHHTALTPVPHNRISRVTANGNVVVPGSEVVIFDLEPLGSIAHNGGMIGFGPDGKLYAGVGDNFVQTNSPLRTTLFGKMLRINKDGTIPADNPFLDDTTGKNRAIWALGLRNPYSFSFQPGTGRMFINDVGQFTWEEIDEGVAGANYGWPEREGFCAAGSTTNCSVPPPGMTNPFFAYRSGDGAGGDCAITGGAFYNPPTTQFPIDYVGDYFFVDHCGGWIRRLDLQTKKVTAFATGIYDFPSDLKVGPDGALYYLSRGGYLGSPIGTVHKIIYTNSRAPIITEQPRDQTAAVGQAVTFSVAVASTAPPRYQWQRNGVNIPNATAASYRLNAVTADDNGATFKCIVSSWAGTATSAVARLTVSTNQPPTGAITVTTVESDGRYSAGETIRYDGTGSDPEDGTLPATAFTWWADLHHDVHAHPFMVPTSGAKSGSFVIPTTGETSANVWYRVYLRVTDRGGLSTTTYRDILPRTSTFTLQTDPPGLQVTLDGQPYTTPATVRGVAGMRRQAGVTPQALGCATYGFAAWSDGGAATHTITTSRSDTTYTATLRPDNSSPPPPGLCGAYFDTIDFTGPSVARIDPVSQDPNAPAVDFLWAGAPAPAIGPDTFSVRWTGFVQPAVTQDYTFATVSNDGVRLWVSSCPACDEQLLIDNWRSHWDVEDTARIPLRLEAGRRYAITMEYYDGASKGVARLLWSSPTLPKQVIPANRLAPR